MGQLIQTDFLRDRKQRIPQPLPVSKQRGKTDAAGQLKRDVADTFELLTEHEERIVEGDRLAARGFGIDPIRPGILKPVLKQKLDHLALGKMFEGNMLGCIFGGDQARLYKDSPCDFALQSRFAFGIVAISQPDG